MCVTTTFHTWRAAWRTIRATSDLLGRQEGRGGGGGGGGGGGVNVGKKIIVSPRQEYCTMEHCHCVSMMTPTVSTNLKKKLKTLDVFLAFLVDIISFNSGNKNHSLPNRMSIVEIHTTTPQKH